MAEGLVGTAPAAIGGALPQARQPFHLLNGIVEGFLAEARTRPGWADEVRRRLGEYATAVAAALPELADCLNSGDPAATAPEEIDCDTVLDGLQGAAGVGGAVTHDDGSDPVAGTLMALIIRGCTRSSTNINYP